MDRATKWMLTAAILTATTTTAGLSTAHAGTKATGTIYVIQGVPGTDVTVSVDGQREASNVATKSIMPLRLATGRHTLAFQANDAAWSVKTSVTVARGESSDVVVHLPAAVKGTPVVTTYRNLLGPVPSGQGRVMVSHTAVVPPADITVNGSVLFSNIANGEFATADVPSGTYKVAVVPTGARDPLLGPLDLTVTAKTLTQVFAIGQPAPGGSMDVIVQTLPLPTAGSPPPSEIDTGSAGLVGDRTVAGAAPAQEARPWRVGVVSLSLLIALCGLLALRTSTRRAGSAGGRHPWRT